jgi:hypothetical protein
VGARTVPATTLKENTMTIPTEAQVEALEQEWLRRSALSHAAFDAYDEARDAFNAGPDTQKMVDKAENALDVAWTKLCTAEKVIANAREYRESARHAHIGASNDLLQAQKAHEKATR